MSVIIRAAIRSDLDAVLAVAAACPEAPHWRPDDYSAYLTPGTPPPLLRTLRVADFEGQIVGFAAATLLPDGQQNQAELDSIAVHPNARRRGVGGVLLRSVLTWAAEQGARRLALEVRAENEPAIRLYQRLGFIVEGRRRGYYADPEEDALLLGMPVTKVPDDDPFSTGKRVEDRLPRC